MRAFALLSALLVAAAPAFAGEQDVTITFDDLAPPGEEVFFNPTYSVGGWNFTGYGDGDVKTDFRILDEAFPGAILATSSDWGFVQNEAIFVLDRGGLPFDLLSFDAGQAFENGDGTLTVTGTPLGGGEGPEVSYGINDETFTSHVFDETWTELVAVRVSSDVNFLGIDDVELSFGLFVDGFESGDLADWSDKQP